MAPLEPLDHDAQRLAGSGHRLGLVVEGDVGVQTAGAADVELALGLGVEVEQDVPLEQVLLQPEGAVHAGLLRGGEERLDGTVAQRVVLEHGQNGGYADAVIGAERRAVGRHPLAVDVGLDGVLLEVEDLVVVLLRHHVEVGLQHHALAVLHPLRGGFAHVDVVARIFAALEPERTGHVEHVAADLLLVRRGARNADDFGEMFPDKRRFEGCQILIHKVLLVFV